MINVCDSRLLHLVQFIYLLLGSIHKSSFSSFVGEAKVVRTRFSTNSTSVYVGWMRTLAWFVKLIFDRGLCIDSDDVMRLKTKIIIAFQRP